ncbi:MAG: hypothetical protein AAF990_06920 [Bacteroidota bacterium]
MKIIVSCRVCQGQIRLKNSVNDRAELSQELGDQFDLECKECSNVKRYHVNDVRAIESKAVALMAFGAFFFGTAITGYLLRDYLFMPSNPYNVLAVGGLLLVPSAVYMILIKQEGDNVSRFNRYKT